MDSELVVRGKPLSKDETKSLLGLIEINKIITSKTTNATNNKLKAEEWVRLTNRFNATATVHRRTPQQLRLKWENLKKNARKRSTKIRMNRIQTGGGAPEYIPPDDVLDRVADLLGFTASGFVVPFGGDKEPEVFVVGGDGDGSGEGAIGEHAEMLPIENRVFSEGSLPMPMPVSIDTCLSSSIPVSIDIGKNTSITDTMENVIEVTECKQTSGAGEVITLATPRRLTLSTPRIGKKKLKRGDEAKTARNLALAEYYVTKKLCLNEKVKNMVLQNENLKLENEKLKLELEKLKNKTKD